MLVAKWQSGGNYNQGSLGFTDLLVVSVKMEKKTILLVDSFILVYFQFSKPTVT